MKQAPPILAVLLLLLMAILAGGAALRESITVDEVAHIGAGLSYLQKLDLRLNQEHPPLAKVLAALPLVLRGVRADYSDTSWTISNAAFNAMLGEWAFGHSVVLRWNDRVTTLLWARLPMLALTLALGVCVYLLASKLGNPLPGCFCLDSCVPGLRPSRSHRCRIDVLLPSHSVELRHPVALTEPSRDDLHGSLFRRSSTVEILLGLASV